jgi:hypothetical protein
MWKNAAIHGNSGTPVPDKSALPDLVFQSIVRIGNVAMAPGSMGRVLRKGFS